MAKIFSDDAHRRISRAVRYFEGLHTPLLKTRQTPTPAKRGEMFQTFETAENTDPVGVYLQTFTRGSGGYGTHLDWSRPSGSGNIQVDRDGYFSYRWRVWCDCGGAGGGGVTGHLGAAIAAVSSLSTGTPTATSLTEDCLYIQAALTGAEEWTLHGAGVIECNKDDYIEIAVAGPDTTGDDWSFWGYVSLGEFQANLGI